MIFATDSRTNRILAPTGTRCLSALLLGLLIGCGADENRAGRDESAPQAEPSDSTPRNGPAGNAPVEAGPPMTSLEADVANGARVYTTYCETCHGPEGRGDGPGATALNPKPRDFSAGTFMLDTDRDGDRGTTADLRSIVRDGAARYGGSSLMVPWDGTLTNQQIVDVVAYVQSIASAPSPS